MNSESFTSTKTSFPISSSQTTVSESIKTTLSSGESTKIPILVSTLNPFVSTEKQTTNLADISTSTQTNQGLISTNLPSSQTSSFIPIITSRETESSVESSIFYSTASSVQTESVTTSSALTSNSKSTIISNEQSIFSTIPSETSQFSTDIIS